MPVSNPGFWSWLGSASGGVLDGVGTPEGGTVEPAVGGAVGGAVGEAVGGAVVTGGPDGGALSVGADDGGTEDASGAFGSGSPARSAPSRRSIGRSALSVSTTAFADARQCDSSLRLKALASSISLLSSV